MKKAILLGLIAALGTGAAASVPKWNPRAPENTQVLPTFSFATVEPVLRAIGARSQRTVGDPAKPSLLVTFANGRKAVLQMSACEQGGNVCKALSIQSTWTRIANSPQDKVVRAIDGFNQRYSFGKASTTADGRPLLTRYLTADYGFVRGNLAVNLLVFANQADRFAAEVLGPLEAAK
jgi:hypothetical protein